MLECECRSFRDADVLVSVARIVVGIALERARFAAAEGAADRPPDGDHRIGERLVCGRVDLNRVRIVRGRGVAFTRKDGGEVLRGTDVEHLSRRDLAGFADGEGEGVEVLAHARVCPAVFKDVGGDRLLSDQARGIREDVVHDDRIVGVDEPDRGAVNWCVCAIDDFEVKREGAFDGADVRARAVKLDAGNGRTRRKRNVEGGVDEGGGGVVVKDVDVATVVDVTDGEVGDGVVGGGGGIEAAGDIAATLNGGEGRGRALVGLWEEATIHVREHHVFDGIGRVLQSDGLPVFKRGTVRSHFAVPVEVAWRIWICN